MTRTFLPTLSRLQLFQRTSDWLQSLPVTSAPTERLLCCHFCCHGCANGKDVSPKSKRTQKKGRSEKWVNVTQKISPWILHWHSGFIETEECSNWLPSSSKYTVLVSSSSLNWCWNLIWPRSSSPGQEIHGTSAKSIPGRGLNRLIYTKETLLSS